MTGHVAPQEVALEGEEDVADGFSQMKLVEENIIFHHLLDLSMQLEFPLHYFCLLFLPHLKY